VLVQPLKSLSATRRVWRKILFSWLLALIFAVPQLLIFVQTQERRSSPGRTQDIIVHEPTSPRSIVVYVILQRSAIATAIFDGRGAVSLRDRIGTAYDRCNEHNRPRRNAPFHSVSV